MYFIYLINLMYVFYIVNNKNYHFPFSRRSWCGHAPIALYGPYIYRNRKEFVYICICVYIYKFLDRAMTWQEPGELYI